jgi:hypothetical protein
LENNPCVDDLITVRSIDAKKMGISQWVSIAVSDFIQKG